MARIKCKHCGKVLTRDKALRTDSDEYICERCYHTFNYTMCRCGLFYMMEDTKTQCDKCEDTIYRNESNCYSTKPRTEFKTIINGEVTKGFKELGTRYYGLELEYNYLSPFKAREIGDKLYNERFIYNKRDASISSGVEIVTAPMTKKVINNYFLKEAQGLFEYIRENVEDYDDNAGVHIHVNLRSIPIMDRYKVHCLLNVIMDVEDSNALYFLCGRHNEYRGKARSGQTYCEAGSTGRLKYSGRNMDRHIALNVRNSNTFEFRLFKSSADEEVIKTYVEIVDKMLEFSHNFGLKDMRVGNFILWLQSHTDNEIILSRVNKILNTQLLKRDSLLVDEKKVLQDLKKVSWERYPRIISGIEHTGFKGSRGLNIKQILDNYHMFHPWKTEPSNSVAKKLYITYKKVLINKIMKEVNKCA